MAALAATLHTVIIQ